MLVPSLVRGNQMKCLSVFTQNLVASGKQNYLSGWRICSGWAAGAAVQIAAPFVAATILCLATFNLQKGLKAITSFWSGCDGFSPLCKYLKVVTAIESHVCAAAAGVGGMRDFLAQFWLNQFSCSGAEVKCAASDVCPSVNCDIWPAVKPLWSCHGCERTVVGTHFILERLTLHLHPTFRKMMGHAGHSTSPVDRNSQFAL